VAVLLTELFALFSLFLTTFGQLLDYFWTNFDNFLTVFEKLLTTWQLLDNNFFFHSFWSRFNRLLNTIVTVEFVTHFSDICKICGFLFFLSILPLPLLGSVAAGHRTIRFLFGNNIYPQQATTISALAWVGIGVDYTVRFRWRLWCTTNRLLHNNATFPLGKIGINVGWFVVYQRRHRKRTVYSTP
jgi:hypothetical protein